MKVEVRMGGSLLLTGYNSNQLSRSRLYILVSAAHGYSRAL